MKPTVFETISHYRIIRKLGAGGMGEVYLAEDTELKRKVAIKLLPVGTLADPKSQKRLIKEAQTAATLDHPNICAIYEAGHHEERSFIAMQYVEGQTLASRIRSGLPELDEALEFAVQVVDALSEAHSLGIIHRDIKPGNIMITARGQAKLMDFGLAKMLPRAQSVDSQSQTESLMTRPGSVVGTVLYMSPEQLGGKQLDGRSDIFSFGAVLYEMLTGRHPFSTGSTAATASAILTRQPPPLARYSPEVPDEMERIVAKALAKKADRRYQTAKDLLIDLKSLKQRLENQPEGAHVPAADSPSESRTSVIARQPVIGAAGEGAAANRGATSVKTASGIAQLGGYAGRHRLACISLAALLLLSVGAGIYRLAIGGGEEMDSVAILPFESDDAQMQYLSDGIAEGLIINLSQLPRLKVMSRVSAFRYRGPNVDPSEIGRHLKVRAVVTGQIRHLGDRLAISIELVDARDNRQIWGMQYNRRFNDILAVQAEMSEEISEKLRLRLSGEQRKRVIRRYTDDTQAYQLYLRGLFYWNKLTEEGMLKSTEYYRQAIERDPNFALAHAALSYSYLTLGSNYLAPQDVMEQAKLHAKKALELDDSLAEAHFSIAAIRYSYDWDWLEAEREYKRTLELNPNHAGAYNGYSYLLQTMKRPEESIPKSRQALELDPLSLIANVNLGHAYYYARQPERAIAAYRKALDLDSSFYIAHLTIARIYGLEDMRNEAMAELNKATAISADNPLVLAATAQVYAKSGKTREAQKILNSLIRMSAQKYVRAYELASIYAALGENDPALVWLERSFQERSVRTLKVNVDPQFDSLRGDPKFQNLLQRIGLPR